MTFDTFLKFDPQKNGSLATLSTKFLFSFRMMSFIDLLPLLASLVSLTFTRWAFESSSIWVYFWFCHFSFRLLNIMENKENSFVSFIWFQPFKLVFCIRQFEPTHTASSLCAVNVFVLYNTYLIWNLASWISGIYSHLSEFGAVKVSALNILEIRLENWFVRTLWDFLLLKLASQLPPFYRQKMLNNW